MIPLDKLIQPMWEFSPYPIMVFNFDDDPEDRKFVYVNSAFTKKTGYSRVEAMGRSSTLLHGPRTNRVILEECELSIKVGKPYRTRLTCYRKDRTEYLVYATVAPLVEPDGSAQYLIVVETAGMPSEFATNGSNGNGAGTVVSLYVPMPLKEFTSGDLPAHLETHPELEEVKSLWFKVRGDRVLPQRDDLDLDKMKRWAAHLSIATVMPLGRFQFRLFGTELANVYGQDLTGRFLDELAPRDLWSIIVRHYSEVVRSLAPLFAPISIANGRWYCEVSRLLLPIADNNDGNRVAYIMGVDYRRDL